MRNWRLYYPDGRNKEVKLLRNQLNKCNYHLTVLHTHIVFFTFTSPKTCVMRISLALILVCFTTNLKAQSLAVNTTGASADASSILDVQSTNKGMLVPRMTKAQKNAIASPAAGLLVYQSGPDSVGFHYYSSTQWIWINPSPYGTNSWSLTGNAGTDTATNFIGTTDNMPIRIKQGNEWIGQLNKNIGSYFIGKIAGKKITSGVDNIGIGDSVLYNTTTGARNTAIGSLSLTKTVNGTDNTTLGFNALNAGTTAFYNTGIGARALELNTTGDNNVAVGAQAMSGNLTGSTNIAIGVLALAINTASTGNTAVGYQAMQLSTGGNDNTVIGNGSLFSNTGGYKNVALGTYNLYNNQTGSNNIAIGDNAIAENTTGNFNIAIGDSSVINNLSSWNLIGIGRRTLHNVTASSHLIAIGDSALYANSTAIKNIALGNKALLNNSTGIQNLAIGHHALKSNIAGFANVAIGDSALSANTTNWNIAIGRNALLETTTGDKNIAIGDGALANNATGNANVAIGYAAQNATSVNNKNNTSLGFRAAFSMQGYSNTTIGGDAMGKPATSYTVNNTVAVGDSALFNISTGGNSNTAVGTKTLYTNTSGRSNTAVGAMALHDNLTGNNNVAIGDSAAFNSIVSNQVTIGSKALWNNVSGTGNTTIGYNSLLNNTNGSNNATLGVNTLLSNISGSTNTAIGNLAGQSNTGSGNVFLGYSAGSAETGSNKLYIDNSNTSSPLLYGDFSTNLLRVNGTLNINNAYSFPTADGSVSQVLQTNGSGAVSWASVSGESTTASNGLTLTGNNVTMGGTLTSNTTITHSNFNLTHSLNGSGDFFVTSAAQPAALSITNTGTTSLNGSSLSVINNGYVGVNSASPTSRLHVVNAISGSSGNYNSGILVENTAGSAGQALLSFKNFVLPGNRAWITGMNTFDNYVIAYGDSLSATNVVLRVDTSGYVGVNPSGTPNSRLDVVGSFGNGIRSTTINTTLTEDDHTLIIGTAATGISIVLPAANTCSRREYVLVNRSTSIQAVTSYLDFSGASTSVPANSAIALQSNGVNWFRTR